MRADNDDVVLVAAFGFSNDVPALAVLNSGLELEERVDNLASADAGCKSFAVSERDEASGPEGDGIIGS